MKKSISDGYAMLFKEKGLYILPKVSFRPIIIRNVRWRISYTKIVKWKLFVKVT